MVIKQEIIHCTVQNLGVVAATMKSRKIAPLRHTVFNLLRAAILLGAGIGYGAMLMRRGGAALFMGGSWLESMCMRE